MVLIHNQYFIAYYNTPASGIKIINQNGGVVWVSLLPILYGSNRVSSVDVNDQFNLLITTDEYFEAPVGGEVFQVANQIIILDKQGEELNRLTPGISKFSDKSRSIYAGQEELLHIRQYNSFPNPSVRIMKYNDIFTPVSTENLLSPYDQLINIYPNPFADELIIHLPPEFIESCEISCIISDINGRICHEERLLNNKTNIKLRTDLNILSFCFVRLFCNDQEIFSKKIIRN
jgi:hypothetical protein